MKLPNTIEELQQMLLEVLVKFAALEEENNRLLKENAELCRCLNQHLSNSHKPPSGDGYKEPALCNAHLLRELQAISEQGRQWAVAMRDFFIGSLSSQ